MFGILRIYEESPQTKQIMGLIDLAAFLGLKQAKTVVTNISVRDNTVKKKCFLCLLKKLIGVTLVYKII